MSEIAHLPLEHVPAEMFPALLLPCGVGYRVYWGAGGLSNVDFATPLATVRGSPAVLTGLAPRAGGRYTLVLRPFLAATETPDLACSALFETDAEGEWLGSRPAAAEWLAAERGSGGQITLRWSWRQAGGAPALQFALYCASGRHVEPGDPQALTDCRGDGTYSHTFTLDDGAVRWFAVAARTAGGLAGRLSPVIGPYVADAAAPAAPTADVAAVP